MIEHDKYFTFKRIIRTIMTTKLGEVIRLYVIGFSSLLMNFDINTIRV